MPRRCRLVIPGAVYHVWSRGVRKLAIFEDDLDRHGFWMVMSETATRYGVVFYEACQMGNHYHFILETPRTNLSEALQFLNGEYARLANRQHGRSGHLFEARFDSQIVQRERYLRKVCRYVVLNPVKAHLVPTPDTWPWSTYRATAGLEPPPKWLQSDWLLWAFRAATLDEARARYRDYVNDPAGLTARVSRRAIAIGSRSFREEIAAALDRAEEDRRVPAVPRPVERVALEQLFAGAETGAPDHVILRAHAEHGYCLTEIAAFLGVNRMQVTRAIRRMMAKTEKRNKLGAAS